MNVDAEQLLVCVARLSRWASRSSDPGLSVASGRLLSLVEELQPVSVSALAHADHTSQPTMSTHVQRLERSGWISREPDPADARSSRVRLTADGAAMLAEARRRRGAVLAPYLEQMSPADRQRLAGAVAALVDLLDRVDQPTATRKSA